LSTCGGVGLGHLASGGPANADDFTAGRDPSLAVAVLTDVGELVDVRGWQVLPVETTGAGRGALLRLIWDDGEAKPPSVDRPPAVGEARDDEETLAVDETLSGEESSDGEALLRGPSHGEQEADEC
jgi:hypothetical protein